MNFTLFFTIVLSLSVIVVTVALVAVLYYNSKNKNNIEFEIVKHDDDDDGDHDKNFEIVHDEIVHEKYVVISSNINLKSVVFAILCSENKQIKNIYIVQDDEQDDDEDDEEDVEYLKIWTKDNFNVKTTKELRQFLSSRVRIVDKKDYIYCEDHIQIKSLKNIENIFEYFDQTIFGENDKDENVVLFQKK
jgi:hypothetical protein